MQEKTPTEKEKPEGELGHAYVCSVNAPRNSSGHLAYYDVAAAGAGADVVENLPRRYGEVFRHVGRNHCGGTVSGDNGSRADQPNRETRLNANLIGLGREIR